MNLKKFKFISIFIIFILGFITHNLYDWFPNNLTAIFFPINESVFEHMKMIFSSYLIYYIIEYLYYKKNNINYQNIKANYFLEFIINIIIFLIIYLPFYYSFDHNLIVTLILYFISISITQLISCKILLSNRNFYFFNKFHLVLFLFTIILFAYLTYNPINYDLFIDKENNKIGFKEY